MKLRLIVQGLLPEAAPAYEVISGFLAWGAMPNAEFRFTFTEETEFNDMKVYPFILFGEGELAESAVQRFVDQVRRAHGKISCAQYTVLDSGEKVVIVE
jgi:hypothetical protein